MAALHSFWMIGASLAFACMSVCIKFGATRFSAPEMVFYRSAIAVILVWSFVRLRGATLATEHAGAHLWRGIVGVISMLMLFEAIARLPLGTAMTLNYTSPLFLALMLGLWAREPIRLSLWFTLLAGFAGVMLLLQPALAREQWLGALLGLGSGIGAGGAFFNLHRLGRLGEPEYRTVFYFLLCASLTGLGWTLLDGGFSPVDRQGALLLLGIGGFGAVGQVCLTAAYRRGRTLVTANLAYSAVVFSTLFGIWFWNETLPVTAWSGMALIVASGIAASVLSRNRPTIQDEDTRNNAS
ncbi:MAG TPA: DMT family transporter [Rhodocyclaceae bacterium]|nr:DMT family transporter [Rhodocyclaceae bacterium]